MVAFVKIKGMISYRVMTNPNTFYMTGHPSCLFYHHQFSLWILKNNHCLRHFCLLCQDRKGADCQLGNFYSFLLVWNNLNVQQNFIEVSKEIYTQGCYCNKDFRSRVIFSPSSSRCEQSPFSGSSHEKQLKNEKYTSCVDRILVPCQNSRLWIDRVVLPSEFRLSLLSHWSQF